MYVQRNTVTPCYKLHPDSLHNFTRTGLFYGKLLLPAAVKAIYITLVQRQIFLPHLTNCGFSRQIFIKKIPDIKFHGNSSGRSHSDACGQMDGRD